MDVFNLYICLLAIIVLVGVMSRRLPIPTPLLLVIVGMLINSILDIHSFQLQPDIVFNIFLPLLVYEASTYTSWPDVSVNKLPIALLSIGHVLFITLIVGVVAHAIIPGLSWPLAFLLGAVISPPDDVAIFAIAEKIQIPQRLVTILTAEGLFNDATALILFRFSLVAALAHQFSLVNAVSSFFIIVIGETLYGLALGHIMGKIRLKVSDPMLEMLLSIMTPFLAYLPAVQLGGCGVLATVVTGLVIGQVYLVRFTPEARLLWSAVWKTIGFTLASILFLLVGLNFRRILEKISMIPASELLLYGASITAVVVIGRFIWVYPAAYLTRYFTSTQKEFPWQFPFIISWAGMRGGISLAAAFSIPSLPYVVKGIDLRDLLIFLVFCVITATLLLQGLTLPWLMKMLGLERIGRHEKKREHFNELAAKGEMVKATLEWLAEYQLTIKNNPDLLAETNIQILEYEAMLKRIDNRIGTFERRHPSREFFKNTPDYLNIAQVIEIEREVLTRLWHEGKITIAVRNKLMQQLDLRANIF